MRLLSVNTIYVAMRESTLETSLSLALVEKVLLEGTP